MGDAHDHDRDQATETFIPLEEARLQIGDVVSLQSLAHEAERYTVRLIGMAKGRSVLVSTPTVDGKYLLMKEGQAFVVRGFSGKNAFAFTTQILKSINTPYPYLHLAYPREIKSLVVRRGTRANVRLICAVADAGDARRTAAGAIVNISVGGALLTLRESFGNKGDQIVVKFKAMVNGIEALLELKAAIRAINLENSADAELPYRVGVQFIDITPDDSIPLLAYVYQELLEQVPGA
jgi:c-di-GMP-binding flagellar brake protein YcgR